MSRPPIRTRQQKGFMHWIENPYLFFFLLLLLLVSTLVAYMYVRNGLNSVIAGNLALSNACTAKQQEVVYLRNEINELSRPGNIQRIAHERLGLVNSTPQADAIIIRKRK
ncbi:MAG: hypothetical protein JXR21_00885 [Candidatus Marinimicrobia bacterium]|nr:hypothetical protein [Candidatus Neomarinimicrobiota bacterium]